MQLLVIVYQKVEDRTRLIGYNFDPDKNWVVPEEMFTWAALRRLPGGGIPIVDIDQLEMLVEVDTYQSALQVLQQATPVHTPRELRPASTGLLVQIKSQLQGILSGVST